MMLMFPLYGYVATHFVTLELPPYCKMIAKKIDMSVMKQYSSMRCELKSTARTFYMRLSINLKFELQLMRPFEKCFETSDKKAMDSLFRKSIASINAVLMYFEFI